MERRDFFATGAALGVVGLASAGHAVNATTITPKVGPSIFDFGAVGDGITDDSAAFSKALQAAATKGQVVTVPGLTYCIAHPITYVSSGNVGAPWGFQCSGATLLSKITTGEDVMSLTSNNTVRYFRLTGGLKITGNGAEGSGFRLFAPGGAVWFYNATIDGLSVEAVGGHGLLFEGNVFETTVLNSYFQDCKKNGATFAQSKGGVCSAISLIGCFFNQNVGNGLSATNFDAQYDQLQRLQRIWRRHVSAARLVQRFDDARQLQPGRRRRDGGDWPIPACPGQWQQHWPCAVARLLGRRRRQQRHGLHLAGAELYRSVTGRDADYPHTPRWLISARAEAACRDLGPTLLATPAWSSPWQSRVTLRPTFSRRLRLRFGRHCRRAAGPRCSAVFSAGAYSRWR